MTEPQASFHQYQLPDLLTNLTIHSYAIFSAIRPNKGHMTKDELLSKLTTVPGECTTLFRVNKRSYPAYQELRITHKSREVSLETSRHMLSFNLTFFSTKTQRNIYAVTNRE